MYRQKLLQVSKDKKDPAEMSEDDVAFKLMTTVTECTNQNAHQLMALEKYFCLLDNDGDSVLKHAIKANNNVAVSIISKSKHFHTIKGIQNKGGEYAVFNAAVEGKANILNFLLSQPNNCRIMPPVCKDAGAPSILHEVISTGKNSEIIMKLLLNDLGKKDKYSYGEVEYIISFCGGVEGYGWIDPYTLAVEKGREDITRMLSAFMHDYHAR
jgi:hypothetical protein